MKINAMKLNDIKPKYHSIDQDYNIHTYVDYVNGVLDNSIVSCEYIKLACQRMKDWFDRDDIYFDVEDVDRRINFVWKLKHWKGQYKGNHFRLLDWQQFIIANIFGWKHKDTGFRVTNKVFVMISRKNGKTALCAAIALAAMIGDKEFGQEIDLVASNRAQAGIAFEMLQNYCDSLDPQEKVFKQYRSEVRIPMIKSKIQVFSSESMGLDGYDSSIVIFDEFHAQKDWSLYNVMKSSQGSRQQPLMMILTTAGFLLGETYPCYSTWETCLSILRGDKKDDSMFSAIYQLDKNDDWQDESVWTKCSPSLNQTVQMSFMRDEVTAAKNNTSLQTGVLTKTFNQWCSSENVWLQYDLLKKNMKPLSLEDLAALPNVSYSYIGVDLSAISDLTSLSLLVVSDDKYYFKSFAFIPEDSLTDKANGQRYKNWNSSDYIIVTPGNVQDYDYILGLIQQIDKILPIAGIYYDTWNAIQFAVNAEALGLPMFPYSQALGNFNRPTKQFELLLKQGKVVMDYNPVVLWCFANSTLKEDFNDNVKPIKADKKTGKIDCVISMLEALGGYFLDCGLPDADLTSV